LQKGVALSHAAVLNQLAAYSDAIGLCEDDVIVSWLPLYHDMGLIAGFLLPLVQGIPLVLMSPFDWVQHPALLFRAIHAHQGTLCWLPNFAYNHCARRIRRRDMEGLSAASMRLFVNCSEPVRHDSHQLFLERFATNGVRPEMLAVSYAMAENTFAVTQTPPGRPPQLDWVNRQVLEQEQHALPVAADHPQGVARVSCGRPIPNTGIRILDQDGATLPERRVGEVAITSDCLLTGYYNRPDLQPFRDGWYQTGDRGYIADGELYVIGRSKDLIINAGKNIYPQDIEAIVNTIPGVHTGRVVAFGVPDQREGTELVVIVAEVTGENVGVGQPRNNSSHEEPTSLAAASPPNEEQSKLKTRDWETEKLIRQEVARQAGVTVSYMHLVGPKWLLKTSSGKIARAANRDKWLEEMKDEG
jgi:acyl-CoA synthetase (AMP-forming)/AMP-acid ligase II